ncbi:acVLRF1 family peptidyl-tRNA hydrolase [Klenkia soli]|uniref:acVLRF1 family peptidyl-tRNA hydrolase n=1 Tax=Klenkia soli TaxID=1052260 RepID=UPI001F6005BD|nr:acVLRF1 family peptidyl-tRNA hydrolase [Klenkia soli]
MLVPPERVERWLDNAAGRHGAFVDVAADAAGVTVTCADGAVLRLDPPFGWDGTGPAALTRLGAAARSRHRVAVLLVRRGRWAVGVFDGPDLVVSKVDSRLVQGRTAAGGWSQQRFARRRGNQTDAVVDHAVETAVRVLGPHVAGCAALATGGDRGLVDEVLADRGLSALAALRRLPAVEVGEPSKDVLLATPALFRAVRVLVTDPV